MNQGEKDRLAKFRQKSETYDCHKDEDGKVFVALLDERIALDAQSRAQADHASSNPSSDPNSSSAAATNDDEDDGLNDDPSTIDATTKEEPADNEDENMKDPDSTTPPASPPAPDSTTVPTAAPAPITLPIQTTSFQTPSGTPIYFTHGNTLIPVASIPVEIRNATLTLIDMYIHRNRLASDTIFCINQRYDGQSTDDADGMGYACKTCVDKWRAGKNYKGYRVCIRHGKEDVGGQMLDGYFVFAQRRTRNGQIVWRSG